MNEDLKSCAENGKKDNGEKDSSIAIPISVTIEDVRNQISETVNRCINDIGIHPSIMELILKDIYTQTREISMGIYQHDKIEFEKKLKEADPGRAD